MPGTRPFPVGGNSSKSSPYVVTELRSIVFLLVLLVSEVIFIMSFPAQRPGGLSGQDNGSSHLPHKRLYEESRTEYLSGPAAGASAP